MASKLTVDLFYEACEALKANGKQPRLPFIFTRYQIEIFKAQGEDVTDTTVNGYPYVIHDNKPFQE